MRPPGFRRLFPEKQRDMSIFNDREFAVLAFAPNRVSGCVINYLKGHWEVLRHGVEPVNSTDPAAAWKQLLRRLGCGRGMRLLITGALPDGLFLSLRSVAIPIRERRGALAIELPRHLPQLPENYLMQFTDFPIPDDAGFAAVNVYVLAPSALERLAAMLTQCERRAEEFCYPLLAVRPGDGAVYLPEYEPDFVFMNGQWHPATGLEAEIETGRAAWRKSIEAALSLPQTDFDFRDYFAALMVARLAVSEDYSRCRSGIGLLPDRLHQVRYRNQLRVTVLLVLILAAQWLWSGGGDMIANYREYYRLSAELNELKTKTRQLQTRMRRTSKERKENLRVAGISAGERDLLTKFAELSKALPNTVRVTNLRWNEDSVDLVMQSESENLNFPAIFESIGYWKIAQLQQRQGWNNAVSTINLKLEAVTPKTAAAQSGSKK